LTDTLLATAGAAAVLFTGTNIDDMLVLSVLNASSRASGLPKRRQIWAGQYAGTAILVALSVAAGRGLTLIPEHWIWVLGLVPLSLGLWRLATAIRARRAGELVAHHQITEVLHRWGLWVIPAAYILIGLYVFQLGWHDASTISRVGGPG
jgi:cadmium resistance protein CadD (predicted permease)